MNHEDADGPRLAVVVKGYPRLSETFVAQELLALQERGFAFDIWSLRHPYDDREHPLHAKISARRRYLPEYLYQEPLRVLRGWRKARRLRATAPRSGNGCATGGGIRPRTAAGASDRR